MYLIYFSLHFKFFYPDIISCCLLFWDLACSCLVNVTFFFFFDWNQQRYIPFQMNSVFLARLGRKERRHRILGFLTYCSPCSKLCCFPITAIWLTWLPLDHASALQGGKQLCNYNTAPDRGCSGDLGLIRGQGMTGKRKGLQSLCWGTLTGFQTSRWETSSGHESMQGNGEGTSEEAFLGLWDVPLSSLELGP